MRPKKGGKNETHEKFTLNKNPQANNCISCVISLNDTACMGVLKNSYIPTKSRIERQKNMQKNRLSGEKAS